MIIDRCYEGVIEKLKEDDNILDISMQLFSLKSNNERVLFVYKLFEELNAFPTIRLVTKNESVSTYYRNHGNNYYQMRKNYEAWQYYNLSLLHAPLDSECYFLAMANRSAVFFSIKKYKESLKDVERVLTKEYPEKLKNKLLRRQEECKKLILKQEKSMKINDYSEIYDKLSMNDTRDPRFPCASPKLQVVYNKVMGRHVIAKEDIKVGEILVDEDPYFTLVLKSQILFCCSYCLSRDLNLIPCDNCCFAFYCSEQCKQDALKDYHAVECPLMATLIDMEFTKLELLALRTVIKARNDHSTWADLFRTIEEAEANMNLEIQGHVNVNDQWVYDSKYYTSIHTLESNLKKRSMSDIFQKSVTAVVFLKFLSDCTDFLRAASEEETEKNRECVAGLLLHHIMTSPTNMHGISSNIQTPDGNYVNELSIASAPYAFHSLLNHSCAPNVVRFSKLGTGNMKLFALRPIKKGMQIFDNYGSHHALQHRGCRITALKSQYKFHCVCEACTNDWPMYVDMKPSKTIPLKLTRQKKKVLHADAISSLQKADMVEAIKLFPRLCRLCESLEPYAPCIELSDCQEALKQCLVIFQGVVPYGHSELIMWVANPLQNLLE